MSAFQQMIDDLYESELALDGRYVPADGSPAFDVRVMKREPTEIRTGMEARFVIDGLTFSVRQSQVPDPVEDDTITLVETADGTAALYDLGEPSADDERLEWFFQVTKRAAP